MLDVFAWIVLLILLAIALAMFFIAGSLPGHIAKSRGHPWVQAACRPALPAMRRSTPSTSSRATSSAR